MIRRQQRAMEIAATGSIRKNNGLRLVPSEADEAVDPFPPHTGLQVFNPEGRIWNESNTFVLSPLNLGLISQPGTMHTLPGAERRPDVSEGRVDRHGRAKTAVKRYLLPEAPLLPPFGTISGSNSGTGALIPEIVYHDPGGEFNGLDQDVDVHIEDDGENTNLRMQQFAVLITDLFLASRKQAREAGTMGTGGRK